MYGTMNLKWFTSSVEYLSVHYQVPFSVCNLNCAFLLFQVLLSSMKNLDKSFIYRYLHPWLGTGLLTSTGTVLYSGNFFQSVEQIALIVVLEVYSWN